MGRKDQFQVVSNPAAKFLEWGGATGKFSYWDGDAQERRTIEPPRQFVVLGERFGVRGFSEYFGGRISSNEVEKVADVMHVWAWDSTGAKKIIAEGTWTEIRDRVKAAGGKFARFVYVMSLQYPDEIWHLSLYGAALSWIDFTVKYKKYFATHLVVWEGASKMRKGVIEYYVPKWRIGDIITPEQDQAAEQLYSRLEAYFEQYRQDMEKLHEGKAEVSSAREFFEPEHPGGMEGFDHKNPIDPDDPVKDLPF